MDTSPYPSPSTGDEEENRESQVASSEREHMFDKVVTPSDVGKLNRLVVPKQHAEKYFPLDSSTNEKGLLLNFEDRTGKPWRFRYSYWNSSQSYVMTKGWSRFVKDKKLDAGDIVSFHRDSAKFFIDWRRRRPVALPLPPLLHYSLPPPLPGWRGRIPWRSYPHDPTAQILGRNAWDHVSSASTLAPRHHFHVHHHPSTTAMFLGPSTSASFQTVQGEAHVSASGAGHWGAQTRAAFGQGQGVGCVPGVLDSVPVVHGKGKAGGKRLRLFGVNMDCNDYDASSSSSSSNIHQFQNPLSLQLEIPESDKPNLWSSSSSSPFSMSLDFDLIEKERERVDDSSFVS